MVGRGIGIEADVVEGRRHLHALDHVELPVRRPAHSPVHVAGKLQNRVAVRLCVQSSAIHPPKQTIVGIALGVV